jgi:hypothetical protein
VTRIAQQGATQHLDRGLHRSLYAVAAFILVESLLLVGLIVVAVRQPDYLWYALVPYLLFTAAFAGGLTVHLRRAGLLSFGVIGPALICVGATLAAFTVALVAAIWAFEGLAVLWTLIYLAAVAFVVRWFARWQAAHMALRCGACEHTFEVPASKWAFSANLGDRKHINCPTCGRHWARIVRREALA